MHPVYESGYDPEAHETKPKSVAVNNGLICSAINGVGISKILLPIVPVKVKSSNKVVETYALLDSGSTSSFCTKELLNQLSVTGQNIQICTTTLTHSKQIQNAQVVKDLTVSDIKNKNLIHIKQVYAVDRLPITKEDSPKFLIFKYGLIFSISQFPKLIPILTF